jgi:hypothetical protein
MSYSNTQQDDARQNGAGAIDAVRKRLPSAEQMRSAVSDNSLAIVGGAFALGLLTGLVVPVSSAERSSIGPLRDSLVNRAGDVAADVVEHGKQVIAETATAAANSAREHGREVLADAQRGV